MSRVRWTRWATCALALSICIPAFARNKLVVDCATFDQADKGEDKIEFTIRNSCSIPVDCSISWRVVCAPESRKRRSVHPGEAKLALVEGATQQAQASASVCGDDSFAIDSISWRCEPNKD
jgi:hypothetical protein